MAELSTSVSGHELLVNIKLFFNELKLAPKFLLYNFVEELWLHVIRISNGLEDNQEVHDIHLISNNKDALQEIRNKFGSTIFSNDSIYNILYVNVNRNGNYNVCKK